MFTQGTNANQFHISFHHVKHHGKFVYPEFSHEPAQGGHPEIILKLSAIIELMVVVNIALNILGKGMHGSKFKNIELPAILPDPPEADENTIGRVVVVIRSPDFASFPVEEVVDGFLLQNFESAGTKSPKGLGAGYHALLTPGDKKIELVG